MTTGISRWCGLATIAMCLSITTTAGGALAQDAACEPSKAAQKYPASAGRVLKVGINPAYPPFSYSSPDDVNKLIGFDVEIINDAMKCAGLKFEYIKGHHTALFASLFGDGLDLMGSNIFFRADRASKAGFVLYMVNGQSLVVQSGNPKHIKSSDDMCGLTAAGASDGTSAAVVHDISDKCVKDGKPAIVWMPAPDQEPAYMALRNGRIDMVMDGAASAALRIHKTAGEGIEVAFTLQTGVKSGLIAPKGNEEILNAVATGLTTLEKSGRLAELMKKYDLSDEWLIPIEVRP